MTRFWKLELAAACLLLIAGSWLVPYRFPTTGLVAGASSEVGFNNAVSYAWYVAFLLVPAFIVARVYGPTLNRARTSSTPDRHGGRLFWIFSAIALLHVVAFAALYFYKGRLFFSEALYFQIVLLRMVAGDRPYLDVSFYYGPSMIYPAFWLSKVMSPQAAYAVWYTATYVSGLAVLMVVLRRILKSDTATARWFVLLSIGFLNPWNGLNVTLVRYLVPSLVLLLVADAVWMGGARRLLAAAGALAFALTYSFDLSALSLAATTVFLAVVLLEPSLRPLLDRFSGFMYAEPPAAGGVEPAVPRATVAMRAAAIVVPAGAAALAFFLAVDPTGTALRLYPEVALSYAAGAHNNPIYPNLPFLTLVALSIVATAFTLAWAADARAGRSTAFAVAFLALMVVTERGAFAVSEPAHIALYALPAILLCLFWSVRLQDGARFRRWIAAAVVVGLLVPVQYFQSSQFWPLVAGGLNMVTNVEASQSGGARATQPVAQTLFDLVRCGGNDHPYVMLNLEYYSQPVYQREHLRYVSYFPMPITARTPAGMERMIDQVRAARAIVIARPADLGPYVPAQPSTGIVKALDLVTGAPSAGSKLARDLGRNQHRLFEPFTDFVRTEYRPLCERDGLVAYGPRAAARP
jgi:hypothetical protein